MGSAGYDLHANERKLESMFPMHTKAGVEVFLENYNHLAESVFLSSDYDALIMIVDFKDAFVNSGLSEKEMYVLNQV
mgnify:CR=1 FL=1